MTSKKNRHPTACLQRPDDTQRMLPGGSLFIHFNNLCCVIIPFPCNIVKRFIEMYLILCLNCGILRCNVCLFDGFNYKNINGETFL